MRFSERTAWDAAANALSAERARLSREGIDLLDLTVSNPTRVGLEYPLEELGGAMRRAAKAPYHPEPLGLREAREQLAEWLSTPGDTVSPDDLILTASTSEAYSFLFKLLCDPGDEVIIPVPAYPLLDHLAALDSVAVRSFPLEMLPRSSGSERWRLHADDAVSVSTERTRAVAVVHPNNPTGSFVTPSDAADLHARCARQRWAIISDEVFFDYPLQHPRAPVSLAAGEAPTFVLGGLSKSAGLPHYKLGWIRLGGPHAERAKVRNALDLIADTYLSVATPVQAALGEILSCGDVIRDAIRVRIRETQRVIGEVTASHPHIELLPAGGGWSAVIRYPAVVDDETLSRAALTELHVVIQPGYFFDFPRDGFFVVSLLTPPALMREGLERVCAWIDTRCGASSL